MTGLTALDAEGDSTVRIGSAGAYFRPLPPSSPARSPGAVADSAVEAFAAALAGGSSASSATGSTGSAPSSLVAGLTAGDRALIQQSTGVAINASGFPEAGGLVPKIALDIAMDRQAGRLPAGQPITATYLKSLLGALPASLTASTESRDINHMLDVLGQQGAEDRFDPRA